MSLLRNIAGLFRINTRNWKAILLCFMAGIVFWLFNALNKNYTTNITVPVAIDYDTEKYVAVEKLPDEVRINLSGVGWTIFRRSIGFNTPDLVIPIEQPNLVRKIVGSSLPSIFSSQLGDLQINYMITDTLYLHVERIINKQFDLAINVDSLKLKQEFELIEEISITPDSVIIQGPQNLVLELTNPLYLKIQKENIDKDFDDRILIGRQLNQMLKTNPDYVNIKFRVIEFVLIQDSLELELVNVPARARPLLENGKVNAEFKIRIDKVDNFRAALPTAKLDVSGLKVSAINILPKIENLPDYVRVQHIDSVSVKRYNP